MKTNTKRAPIYTHEGGKAARAGTLEQLRRSVMSCLLWEREFYEDGELIADRITRLCQDVPPRKLAELAVEVRNEGKMRHAPLLLAVMLCQTGTGNAYVSETIRDVIQRADELTEFVAIYAKVNGVSPDKVKKKLSAQAKRGLALAFVKFDAYQLAKYNRPGMVRLRDVLFLCHAKPHNEGQATTWKKLINGELEAPDTWEVALSAGADKKEAFERLLKEERLGYMALLRNLRNMQQAGCDMALVRQALANGKGADRVLPFRFVAAARACPDLEPELDAAMAHSIAALPKLSGKTLVLVDVSDSMNCRLSQKSDISRMDAAAALAAIVNGDQLLVYTFSQRVVKVPPRRGMAGVDAITNSQHHWSTHLAAAVHHINATESFDRAIIITDEQSHDGYARPNTDKVYVINVASNQNGVAYGRGAVQINGFSENVIRFIHEFEG